jgi:HEPN domain-containing protein
MIEFESIMIDEESFAINYADAKSYYHRALQFQAEGYRPSLAFNIASVALERYLVALCDLYGEYPRNHNYITLMRTVETLVEVPKELNKRIKVMDWIFGICSIDEYRHPNPDETDMENALVLCVEVQKLFDQKRMAIIAALAKRISLVTVS